MKSERQRLERLGELLVDRATCGLQSQQRIEFEALARQFPAIVADESYEVAAAAVDDAIGAARGEEALELPSDLRSRLLASGLAAVDETRSTGATSAAVGGSRPAAGSTASNVRRIRESTDRNSASSSVIPWLLAAAASLLAVVGWWQAGSERPAEVSPVPTVVELRERLIQTAADLTRLDWTATPDEAAILAEGDVVWSPTSNTGYMRIAGLQPNVPSEYQYQLWIFDKDRDERYPVDGGVFDIPQDGGEVIVPIHATLPVQNAVLFAITVEKPGGVVVSGRERIVLLAQGA